MEDSPTKWDGNRLGAHAVAPDAAGGVAGDRAGKRWLGRAPASRRRTKTQEAAPSRKA